MFIKKTIQAVCIAALAVGVFAVAQSEDGARESVEKERVATIYYNQKMDLALLENDRDVVSVFVPDSTGTMALHSFDTPEEAQAAAADFVGQDRATKYCVVFKDANYGGSSFYFYGWDYNDLDEIGWNDKISSFICSDFAYLTFYAHANFSGTSLNTASENLDRFPDLHHASSPVYMGDVISSIYFHF